MYGEIGEYVWSGDGRVRGSENDEILSILIFIPHALTLADSVIALIESKLNMGGIKWHRSVSNINIINALIDCTLLAHSRPWSLKGYWACLTYIDLLGWHWNTPRKLSQYKGRWRADFLLLDFFQ